MLYTVVKGIIVNVMTIVLNINERCKNNISYYAKPM